MSELSDLIALESALNTRAVLSAQLGKAFGGSRDYYQVLGYDHEPNEVKYYSRFRRQDIASRIVTAYPDAMWMKDPCIYEDETEIDTEFESTFKTLARNLKLFHHFKRADIQACLGRFSVLFIGFADVKNIKELEFPVTGAGGRVVRYLSEYGERHVSVAQFDHDISSPRFGLPLLYEIDFDRGQNPGTRRGRLIQSPVGRPIVHWERVIHIADDLIDDDVYGIPKLEGVYNLLDDLLKVVGGGAEMFWRTARRDLFIEVDADASLSDADLQGIRERTDEYIHDLRHALAIQGAKINTPSVEVASPLDHFQCILQLISGRTRIPMRKLLGSERGELASSQDEANWAQEVMTRQSTYGESAIIRPFLDRLIAKRALPTPKEGVEGYTIEWESLLTEDEGEKAETAARYANAWNSFASGSAFKYLPLGEAREIYFGLEAESPYEMSELQLVEEPEEEVPAEGDDAEEEGVQDEEDEEEANAA